MDTEKLEAVIAAGDTEIVPSAPVRRHRQNISRSSTSSNSSCSNTQDSYSNQFIKSFYESRYVFITGATGFVGKVLLEKLLRCCWDVSGIFLLVRPRKGRSPHQRLEDIITSPVFNMLRELNPKFHEKLIVMHGDVNEENFGLHEENLRRVLEETSVVFHVAATVRFDEPLKVAVEMNLAAVQTLVNLCRQMKQLKALVHVSTAYANCDRNHIEETVYEPQIDPQKLIDIVRALPDKAVEAMTPHVLQNKPNTYTFTKGLAESYLMKAHGDLPLAIVRPSIVGSAWRDPIPGWTDNAQGPNLLFIANGKGLLRSMTGHRQGIMDVIPVDLTVNLLIAVAWRTASLHQKGRHELMVYNCTSGAVNPLKWGQLESTMVDCFVKNPLDLAFRRPKVIFTDNPLMHSYWMSVSHLLPAYIFDMAMRLVGKKPRLVKTFGRIHKAVACIEFFTTHEWDFPMGNVGSMIQEMSSSDRDTFFMDAREVNWPSYIENYCLGMKRFLLKEDLNDLPTARRHQRRLNILRYAFNTIMLMFVWRFVVANSRLASGLWYMVLSLVSKFVRFFRMTSS